MLIAFLHSETEVQKALSWEKKIDSTHPVGGWVAVGVAVHTQIWTHALSQEWTKQEKAHNHMTRSIYNYDLGSNIKKKRTKNK